MKVLQTKYNGYHFRSRTEARWAVFFDKLNLKYDYEKEGFDLQGTWYLPDFYLPDLGLWFEVKGADPTETELTKCNLLAEESKQNVCLAIGAPDKRDFNIIIFPPHLDAEGERFNFLEDRRVEGAFWLGNDHRAFGISDGEASDKWPIYTDRMVAAYSAALGERLNHEMDYPLKDFSTNLANPPSIPKSAPVK